MRWRFVFFLYLAATVLAAVQAEAALAGPEASPQASAPRSQIVSEVLKQSAEQPLHFLMAAGPIWLSRYLTAVPRYGWWIIPALAYREWRQWPSDRWWDPLLDATFLILGVIGGSWRGKLTRSISKRRAVAATRSGS